MGIIKLLVKLLVVFAIALIIGVAIIMDKTNAWVGGQLSINNIGEGDILSGIYVVEPHITGEYSINQVHLYGRAINTNIPAMQLLAENLTCLPWANNGSCSITLNTSNLEDSSIWQFYISAENASDPSDKVTSVTITDVIIHNTIPSFKVPTYITPNKDEILKTNNVKFGALVNPKTTTACIITFTSNNHPGKRVYTTEYESGEYCNLTITDVPENIYEFVMQATDGKDLSQKTALQKFTIDLSASPEEQNEQQSPEQAPSDQNNLLSSKFAWITGVVILLIFMFRGRRRR